MKRYLFAIGLAWAALTGCAVDPSTQTTDDQAALTVDDPTASDSQAIEVPEALQPITNAFSCSSLRGSCLTPTVCNANGGRHLSATGCTGTKICCGFNPCLNANPANQCTSKSICTANGSQQSLSGCATSQVCCRF